MTNKAFGTQNLMLAGSPYLAFLSQDEELRRRTLERMKPPTPDKISTLLQLPSVASTSILLAQGIQRQKALQRKGRRSTNITGGLSGEPTLGSASLLSI